MSDSLEFKPDFEAAKRRWLAFWAQDVIDRPCCIMLAPRDGATPASPPPYMSGAREEFGPVIERVLAHAESRWWGGDAMPCYTPSFGPDMFAAWLGADLEFDKTGYGTNWAVPCVDEWEASLPLRLDSGNCWWQRMLAFCRALADAFEGKMLVSHLDLHSNMDALAALRSPERLCMDLMDIPAVIDRAVQNVTDLYAAVYEGLYDAGNMGTHGTTGWVPAYHPVRTNTIQCDFAALIGPEHFRRFVLPALEAEAAYLGHCVYHLDGPECLVHLDDLCSIDGLDCIQWTTGARNKAFIEWLDLLKRIQAMGKSVWVPCDTNSIKVFHRELKPNQLFYVCSAPDQKTGEETLAWLERNT
jgi:5-methyltetrahydrofolate--homocysteine methyltransferase